MNCDIINKDLRVKNNEASVDSIFSNKYIDENFRLNKFEKYNKFRKTLLKVTERLNSSKGRK